MKFIDLLNGIESKFEQMNLREKYYDSQIMVILYNIANDSLIDGELKEKVTDFIKEEGLKFQNIEIPDDINDN